MIRVEGVFMNLGEQLAAARAARGLSLEELAHRTKIPVGRLRALEASAYELLPPPTFTRGYLRACAREVGLDSESLVLQYENERPVPPKQPVEAPIRLDSEDEKEPRSISRNAVLTAAGIALVAVLIWTGRDPSPAADRSVAAPSVRSTRPVKDAVGTTGSASSSAPSPISVGLRADRLCWIEASADGKRVIYRLLQPGEHATIDARERVLLRVGDAGAVTLSVNGEAPKAAGARGEVRTLTFGRGDRAG
jgi:cytoskeleton protein RodZ